METENQTAENDAPECECPWTDPSTWLSAASCGYGGGYEPGSQREWNPDCPAHPAVLPPDKTEEEGYAMLAEDPDWRRRRRPIPPEVQ